MPGRSRHPRKEGAAALRETEDAGWRVTPTASGHRWGVLRCPEASREGCQASVWSTPRSPGTHAKQLRRVVTRCPHRGEEGA